MDKCHPGAMVAHFDLLRTVGRNLLAQPGQSILDDPEQFKHFARFPFERRVPHLLCRQDGYTGDADMRKIS